MPDTVSHDRPSVMQAFSGLSSDEMEILAQADRFAQNEVYPLAQRMDDEEWWPAIVAKKEIINELGPMVSPVRFKCSL